MTINKIKDKLVLAFIFAIFFVTMFGFNQVEAADYNIDDSHYDDKQQKIYDNTNSCCGYRPFKYLCCC